MKQAIESYLEYLVSVKNSSPHTISNYGKDLRQFVDFLTPPGAALPALTAITHGIIREFVAHLHDQGLQKVVDRAEAGGVAFVFQVLRARGHDQGKPRAAGAYAEIAEAHSFDTFRGRDERFSESPGGNGRLASQQEKLAQQEFVEEKLAGD